MLQIALISSEPRAESTVLPCLELLPHRLHTAALSPSTALAAARTADVAILDGRHDLVAARNTALALASAQHPIAVLLVLADDGLAVVSPAWRVRDVILASAGAAEVEARLRLAAPQHDSDATEDNVVRAGSVVIDERSYTVRVDGRALNLTYKEFELLKHLAQHVGRVFTRAQLLSEVWGYDYFGGTRTVDVHVRRLRAKLGADHEHLITTVRNVGYSFTAGRDPQS